MPGLAAGFASGILRAQRVVAVWAFQSVAGWRLAAVGAVFVEATFQLGDSCLELRDASFEFGDDPANDLHDGIHPTLVKGSLDDGTEDCGAIRHGFGLRHRERIYFGFLKDLNSYDI